MTLRPHLLLPDVIDAVAEAGRRVAEEFARPAGPRLIDHVTAPVDHEIELFLRDRLIGLVPARFVGEEAGIVAAEANGLCWVVDPHDGTRAFLEGKRGSAVSVALLRDGTPVLGVVFAPLCPDRGPDMIAWAEGTAITRNGAPVTIDLRGRGLARGDVVFLNHGVWQRPVWNTIACAPARFMPLPSIAYRLARIAVGDGIATQTLRPVNALDIAAGHALLMAAGGVLVAEDGQPVTYNALGESRPSACFGGAPDAVATLLTRAWRGSTEDRREPRIVLDWPRAPDSVAFDRAAGCLLGLAIGDARATPGRLLGQPGDGTEMAIALARALAGRSTWDAPAVAAAQAAWQTSVRPDARPTAADALMRATPIGVWADGPAQAAALAAADRTLPDTAPDTIAACAGFAAAVAAGIGGADPGGMAAAAGDLPALQPAFRALAEGTAPADGVAGALAGAARGRTAFPTTAVMAVLTCRPDALLPDGLLPEGLAPACPRPDIYWTDDLIDLAEALLMRPSRSRKEPA